jgi:ubiquitin-conjugating enzyme E2 D/E
MSKAAQRLKNEFNSLINNNSFGATIILENESDLFGWIVVLQGPEDTAYSQGVFKLKFKFPENYPFKAPDVKFLTTVYHPNIKTDTGEICQDVFASSWAPTQKVEEIIEKIITMLKEPSTSTPLENDICQEYTNNREKFNKTAREYTTKYAYL